MVYLCGDVSGPLFDAHGRQAISHSKKVGFDTMSGYPPRLVEEKFSLSRVFVPHAHHVPSEDIPNYSLEGDRYE